MPEKPPPAKNRQTAVAISKPLRRKRLTLKSPHRHRSQQGSVSDPAQRLLKEYQDELYVRLAPGTARRRLDHARLLVQWLEERGVGLGSVRASDLHAYQGALLVSKKRDGSAYSVASHVIAVAAMKRFFGFLLARGVLLTDPSARVPYPRVGDRLPRAILSEAEARRIVDAPDTRTPRGLRDRALLETVYATGLRAGELMRLTPYDVDTDERVLRVVLGKGRRDRVVPLTARAARALEDYLMRGRPGLVRRADVRWLFLGSRGGLLQNCMLNHAIARYARQTHLKKRISCHTFRHSVATHLLRHRADIRHIQALLGHKSLASTERYTRVEVQDLREVLKRAHPRGR